MNKNNTFEKPPISIGEQLKLLSSRGLLIQNKQAAEHYLKFISYYRFCGYASEFEDTSFDSEKHYREGTTFEQVVDCYIFDHKLRLIIIDAIEKIETAIRTVITNELSLNYGAHWYLDNKLFLKKFKHCELIQSIEKETFYKAHKDSVQHKKREWFIQHYFNKYSNPKLPAAWMVAEVLSFGTWSLIFANLINREDQKQICRHFNISYKLMTS